jgi:hypothetical protein
MSENVTISLANLNAKIKKLDAANKMLAMQLTGQKALQLNEDQISKEIDRDGKRFPPYSLRYQKMRADGFGKGKPRDPNTVDLVITGQMLQNFDVQNVTSYSVTIGFSSPEEARKARGVYQNPKRPIKFVGLTQSNRQKLLTWFYKRFIAP